MALEGNPDPASTQTPPFFFPSLWQTPSPIGLCLFGSIFYKSAEMKSHDACNLSSLASFTPRNVLGAHLRCGTDQAHMFMAEYYSTVWIYLSFHLPVGIFEYLCLLVVYLHICICVPGHVCHSTHLEVRALSGASSPFYLYVGSGASNSGLLVAVQLPSLAEPSHWPTCVMI